MAIGVSGVDTSPMRSESVAAKPIERRDTERLGPLRGRTLDNVTPAQWRGASHYERSAFQQHWHIRGFASHSCLTCGYPTAYGQASCEACR